MEKKTLGTFIAVLRKAKGLTQKQLAEMLNVSDKAISRWERDECAPDLSVIPVLADIFDITADELLRGQRKQPQEPVTHYGVQKTETQIRYLLKKKETDFTILSCVSIGIALFGLIAAMIGNLGFLRGYIGFFVSCIFFIPAALCPVIFLVRGLRSLEAEELEEVSTETKKAMILQTELSLTITVCLFAACLPLIVLVHDTYVGLSAGSWALYGLLWGGIAAIICLVICLLINKRLGYQTFSTLSTPRNKLRIRSALILAAVLLATYIVHGNLYDFAYANLHWMGTATKWETWEELKEYLETPIRDDGEELEHVSTRNTGYVDIGTYIAPDGSYMDITDRNVVLVYKEDMKTPEYECIRRNQSVKRFYYSPTDDHFPIYTMDSSQLIQAENKLVYIHLAFLSIGIVEFIAAILIYRRTVKKL